ncbi:MAG: OadG family protein [Spirochaetales bacterium]|nr:OadG family protein [Spirochaetales bacterium]MBQ2259589.1 OadG family protein [Spirochaetales bacterium]
MLALLENLPKETLSTQLGYGAVLMLLGMATVFLFLVILIFCTKAMSRIVGSMGKKAPVEAKKPTTSSASVQAAPVANDAAIAAAIAAAYDKSNN